MKRSFFHSLSNQAFSLIEITCSLCIISFCMVPLVGLMGISTEAGQLSASRSGAVSLVQQIATSIRTAKPTSTGEYTIAKPDVRAWYADGTPITPLSGSINAYAYHLEITPPDASTPDSLGRAVIRVSWPATATWNQTKWENARGTEEAVILFRAP